jgi:protein TonB
MFEDSTFESTGRIRTRSRGWAIAALGLNSAILLALVAIPLIHPEAMPRQRWVYLIPTPPPPSAPPVMQHPTQRVAQAAAAVQEPFAAPRQIPPIIVMTHDSMPPGITTIGPQDLGTGVVGGDTGVLPPVARPHVVVSQASKTTTRIPSNLAAGLLIYKPLPPYPAIARATHQEGTVVLAATISKDGTIANLRVVSGPAMLQGAAVDAVRNWRYRPYMLNGEPVEVETTINVNFTMGG